MFIGFLIIAENKFPEQKSLGFSYAVSLSW